MKNLIYLIALALLLGCASIHHEHQNTKSLNSQSIDDLASVEYNKTLGRPSGRYVFINQNAYRIENSLDETLNELLPNFSGKTVQVELNTTEYQVLSPIILPNGLNSRVIIKGNNARLNCNLKSGEFAFDKQFDSTKGVTSAADTYQSISDLYLKGELGGAIKYSGGYQSRVDRVFIHGFEQGILYEFVLQGQIHDVHLKGYSDIGIHLRTIGGTNVNTSQCNQSTIENCRLFSLDANIGIKVRNSNLVQLEGIIIEGGKINRGVHFYNVAPTVVNFRIKKSHFENSEYREACIYVDGNSIGNLIIDEMYYHGRSGLAIQSNVKKASDIKIYNTMMSGWKGVLKSEEPKFRHGYYSCRATHWHIFSDDTKSAVGLFTGHDPWNVFLNNKYIELENKITH